MAALAQLGVQDAPEGDLRVFFHRCQRTQLDPFAKQIYMIGRNTKVTQWVNGRQTDRWEMKYTIQTGIEGYRVLGNRKAAENGDDLDHDEVLWCGLDGQWIDMWLDDQKPPHAAKYVIRKNGKPFVAKVLYTETVQTQSNGEPNSTWKKRPAGQLSKCAEALAWRMAYPQDFAGLELADAVVIEPDGTPSPTRVSSERVAPTAAEIIAAPASNPGAKSDTAQVTASPEGAPKRARGKKTAASSVTQAQIDTIGAHMKALGVEEPDQFDLASRILGRKITSATELTETDADDLIAGLLDARDAEAAPIEGAAQ
ncbi:recombinase RecT [Nocardia niigatensis]